MAENKPRVLLVEDTRSLAVVYEQYLRQDGYEVLLADCGQQALDQLMASPPPVVLLDLELPDMSGMDILQQITEQQLPCAVVVITAHGSVDVAVEAMRLGAFDFLTKPFDSKRLCATARNALKHQQLSSLVAQYRENFERHSFAGFIGASMPMQAVYRIIESAAPSKATVFITGESGTGKEVCAEAIHQCSPRRDQPFIALNCAAIPHDLMESEIFGHVKGSFTGAQGDRKGAASLADGGTLFLDELCEMDLDLQSKLLRFIQTGTLQRVGSSKLETVDVRFVCATNRDPLVEVKAGRFREDLYYRLHVIPLYLPPLRERGEDILLLARSLLQSYAKEENKRFKDFDAQAARVLLDYPWPGNVRELQNVVRNIVVLNDKDQVSQDILPPPLNGGRSLNGAAPVAQPAVASAPERPAHGPIRPLWLVEKEVIEQAIASCDGNIPKAAALLEISPSTIYRKKQGWEEANLA
ncbi:sigma-54-dependent Fis family transcriptional regulator [Aeromonas enteropelogenes]|uniref:Sigma-54 dependent transcriptional regulator n=3 Tax=Aeromonas TaxID=642 RepID=A0AAU6TBP9_9GAMM|nr:sigma-54 dependent transcriptional regulator [Aeromonas enteropelogenes]MBL0459395.1 sigma-54-dependent Fis family transcriptional regulator [Aeromonas enteropelogenes]MBL0520523.1 sigma-54-dependent Fis family transcriptional regulator [Aeromonas enteropelogenes]UBH50591.1 sigma-54 dependent transcriptional regulator [Aeromonas enteropelogenes]BEE16567.1 sigma-54-dependent Fis family transcriptional regulator [Aeromonas enteropelogenes]BEE20730.1 sigma-54-dependent Fis family transcription